MGDPKPRVVMRSAGERQPGATQEQVDAAALLIHCARCDEHEEARERLAVRGIASERWTLSGDLLGSLVSEAEQRLDDARSPEALARRLRASWSAEERLALVGDLRRVAEADGVVHRSEEALLRRLAATLFASGDGSGAGARLGRIRCALRRARPLPGQRAPCTSPWPG